MSSLRVWIPTDSGPSRNKVFSQSYKQVHMQTLGTMIMTLDSKENYPGMEEKSPS